MVKGDGKVELDHALTASLCFKAACALPNLVARGMLTEK
jgi:hypothetical protein